MYLFLLSLICARYMSVTYLTTINYDKYRYIILYLAKNERLMLI